jgi:8-oxo-dGTP pyrophosphatase MutT (NUDIX family)
MAKKLSFRLKQSAVIPFRIRDGLTEVVLISASSSKNWVNPKGGIEKLMSPEESAAKEAFEEAGVIGDVSNELFAEYAYNKRGRKIHVKVYSLEVSSILVQWDEMKKRKRCCVEVGEAIGLIKKKQKKVLRKFQEMLCTIY